MPDAIATAYVKLIPTFDKQLKSSIAKQLGQVDGGSAGSKAGKLFSRGFDKGASGMKASLTSRLSATTVAVGNIAARAFAAVASSVGNSLDSAIKRVDTMNNFPRIMEGMGISAASSEAAIQRLSAGIDGLPTALDDAVSGVSRFTSKNGDIDKSTEYFLAVNNAIASGGQSMQVQSSALEQLSQSYSKGKMDMMEWRSLQQAMPAQLNQIARAMGTTADALGEGLRDGSVSMDEFMEKIVELNESGIDGLDSFEQQARKATGGIGTAMTNVQNRVNKAVAGVIDAIGQDNISGAINAFSSQFGKIGRIFGAIDSASGEVVGFVGGLKDALAGAFDGWEPEFDIDWDSMFEDAALAATRAGEIVGELLAPAVKFVDEVFSSTATTLSEIGSMAEEALGPFVDKIAPGFEKAGELAEKFFSPIGDFLTGHGPAFDGMMERIRGHFDDMSPVLDSLAETFNKFTEHMRPIAEAVGPAIAEVLGQIGSALFGVVTIMVGAADFVLKVVDAVAILATELSHVPGEIASFFEGIPETIGGFFDGVRSAAQAAFDGLVDFASSIPDKIVGFFSGLGSRILDAIGSIVLPISAPSSINVAGQDVMLPYPSFASGGIFTRPTMLHQVGEAGAEAIIPLSNRQHVRPFAQAVAAEMHPGGSSSVTNIYIDGVQALPDSRIYDVSYELATTILDQRRA